MSLKLAPKKVYRNYRTGVNERGLVYTEIDLISIDDIVLSRRGFLDNGKIKKVTINALVDSGAYMLTINENIRAQLDLPFIEKQFGRLADETLLELDVVGAVEVRFENRRISAELRRHLTQAKFRRLICRTAFR